MSTFREHKTSADRSANDRKRHKEKIEKALKEGIHNVVANESIIGKDGKARIKIPVKGIKEYRFIFGDGQKNKQVGTAPGADKKKGQVISQSDEQDGQAGSKAGNEPGEELYEVEITLSELASYLFDDLNLPDLEKRRMKNVLGEKVKRHGHRPQGIRPRLDKKETLKKKIRRSKAAERHVPEDDKDDFEGVSLSENDLVYRHVTKKPQESSNAVVFLVMDISGSMTDEKKYLARSFFFVLCQFLQYKYEKVEIIFIAHTTDAEEVSEENFFKRQPGGGTLISPAVDKVLEIIDDRYDPSNWNIYAFHCSDGDNWTTDCERAVVSSRKLKEKSQMCCYCEIIPLEERLKWDIINDSQMLQHYKPITDKKFMTISIGGKEDIWPSFKKIFGGKLDV